MSEKFSQVYRHVQRRLKEAGQDVANGKLLGKERCAVIAEAAVEEWRDMYRGPSSQPRDPWGDQHY